MRGFILLTRRLKQLCQRRFLEDADAENLENLVERQVAGEMFFEDCNQSVNANGDPKLGAHRVGTGSVKSFNSQLLFEPAKEQLDLPALLIEPGDRQRRKTKMIGQENECPVVFDVVEAHPAQFVRIVFGRVEGLQADNLVAAQARADIDRLRIQPAIT